MRSSLKSTKITFTVLLIIALLVIGLATYMAISSSNPGAKPPRPTATPTPTPLPSKTEGDVTCEVVVVSIATAENQIRVYEPEKDEYIDLNYTGSSDIRDRFGQVMSAKLLAPCSIAEVSYDSQTGRIYRLYLDNEYWFFERPTGWELSLERNMFTTAGTNYRVSKSVAAFCADGQYDAALITDMDVISVYGKGQRVFAIELVKGHGTVYVMNEKDFVGGSIYVDNVYAGQITEDFMLAMREGSYEISFSLGDLNGKQEIEVGRNGTAVVDMKPFVEEKKEYGYVNFYIKPEEAQLFIDNYYYDATEPVKLSYGTHFVEVTAQGYTSWGGSITVVEERMNLSINLVEMFVPTPTPTGDPDVSPTPGENPEVSASPEPTEEPEVSPTPTPGPTEEPEASATPGPTSTPVPTETPAADEKEVSLSWYPSALVMIDSKYVGTTDASGLLKVKMTYGTHIVSLVRTTIDGSTQPKNYEITVDSSTAAYVSIPMQ